MYRESSALTTGDRDIGVRHREWLYSPGMTGRIGAKGQVVIPKAIRDQANLHPGDKVGFELRDGGEIVIIANERPPGLGGRFANSGMAARLVEDRRREPQ